MRSSTPDVLKVLEAGMKLGLKCRHCLLAAMTGVGLCEVTVRWYDERAEAIPSATLQTSASTALDM